MAEVLAMFRAWWSAPAGYEWTVDYLRSRGLLGGAKLLIGVSAAAIALIPVFALFSPAGPSGRPARTVDIVFIALTLLWTLRWWFAAWPSPAVSAAFIAYADVGITLVCLQDHDRLAGMFGLTTFVVIGTYTVFFHGPKALAVHLGWALTSILLFTAVLATDPHHDPAIAIAKALVSIMVVGGTTPFMHFGLWVLRGDAVGGLSDPLTGLLNRRGLALRAARIPEPGVVGEADHLVAIAIDLDHFKAINDTFGHVVGDEVLVRTARRISSVVRASSATARVGGEEFVVLDTMPAAAAAELAERIRTAIGAPATNAPVTASIGVSSVAAAAVWQSDSETDVWLTELLERADLAMYQAKQAGRDAVRLSVVVSGR